MLVHLHVKNLALIEEIEVEFGPGLNILTGETGAGKSILLGSMQLILGAKTSKNMIRENASYALVELLFQVENEKALETLKALDICPEDGQVLLSRKIMDGRSINKINGETSTVGQMKAAAACLLDIHGQHEHQSLLYQDKQLAILDAYGKEKILPAKEKVSLAYKEYSKCKTELGSMNMNEEQRNRELAFLEFEIKEIEKANLQPGEDEELEARYRKMSNAKLIVDSLQLVHNLTGYESKEGAGETVGEALKEFSHVTQYDPELTPLAETLTSVDGLLNDFNRELSAYLDLKPALTREQLDARILREFEAGPNKQFKNVIGVLFPSSLTPVMLELGGIPAEKKIHDISREERQHFIDLIKAFPFTITGMGEFKEAIITRGGVSVKEINPGTMESKKISGLYFAGEVLDLDAVTGGYNLQIAWSTAYLAAQAIQ